MAVVTQELPMVCRIDIEFIIIRQELAFAGLFRQLFTAVEVYS